MCTVIWHADRRKNLDYNNPRSITELKIKEKRNFNLLLITLHCNGASPTVDSPQRGGGGVNPYGVFPGKFAAELYGPGMYSAWKCP